MEFVKIVSEKGSLCRREGGFFCEISLIEIRIELSKNRKDIKLCKEIGLDKLLICIAKTPYSLSDDPQLLGRPKGFKITVREIKFSAGAGFLVPMTGKITTMPGLPAKPTSELMDLDDKGNIAGLF